MSELPTIDISAGVDVNNEIYGVTGHIDIVQTRYDDMTNFMQNMGISAMSTHLEIAGVTYKMLIANK